ncbi:hypothetical protein SAMN02910409_0192, partial [Prevotellaceae bacterium HUN156]
MKLKNISLLLLMATAFGFNSCSEDGLNNQSVFEDVSNKETNEFDIWLENNYRQP